MLCRNRIAIGLFAGLLALSAAACRPIQPRSEPAHPAAAETSSCGGRDCHPGALRGQHRHCRDGTRHRRHPDGGRRGLQRHDRRPAAGRNRHPAPRHRRRPAQRPLRDVERAPACRLRRRDRRGRRCRRQVHPVGHGGHVQPWPQPPNRERQRPAHPPPNRERQRPAPGVAETYTDPAGRFSVPIPTNWSLSEHDGYVLLTDPEQGMRVYLLVLATDDLAQAADRRLGDGRPRLRSAHRREPGAALRARDRAHALHHVRHGRRRTASSRGWRS